MIKSYALINNNIVENLILINSSNADIISTLRAVEVPDNLPVSIGWEFINNTFINPNPTTRTNEVLVPLTDEDIALMIQELQSEITTNL